MYEKVKTVNFGDIEVTLYLTLAGEYFAEYNHDGDTARIQCGRDYQFIWEHLSSELGADYAPSGWDLIEVADAIEKNQLTRNTSYGEICAAVESHLYASDKLWPAYVRADVISILEYRYGHVESDSMTRVKLCPMATMEEWLHDSITTRRIYRMNTDDEYKGRAVRIIGAYKGVSDYILELEVLEINFDANDTPFWDSGKTLLKLMSECALVHKKVDELPPEYEEVPE